MTEGPHVIVLAGPNGAGKSTAAPSVLADKLHVAEFVNADVIARGLSGFHPEAAAFDAGRIMLDRLHQLAAKHASFAFETTLASRSFAPWIAELRSTGYRFDLVYFWLPSAEAAIARVAARVRDGGHDVPAATIKRRYAAGLRNFFTLYRPLTDRWRMYDNREPSGPLLIASGAGAAVESVMAADIWEEICGQYER